MFVNKKYVFDSSGIRYKYMENSILSAMTFDQLEVATVCSGCCFGNAVGLPAGCFARVLMSCLAFWALLNDFLN